MTSEEIRHSFLEFFKSRQHSIVPSSSLLPDSPNLLFTNAGMNQFVPIFLGERKADVSRIGGAIPGSDTRAADTQKCIRAGGKHNDLDDVGIDTYHHTFFEMLGNWSFGDYFKAEAIAWAWELVVNVWGFPKNRVYATVYAPGEGDPSEFDQEAYDHWAAIFTAAGLDPAVHIVRGNKKDNFWMMGETGPCGPCSELHIDLTPDGGTAGRLVNMGSSDCIEIWNLVFIQYNANADGSFSPLPARHVDTGMGFERVTSIIQGTKNFTDFANARISNYETDLFRPLFDALERMSGHKYRSTLPSGPSGHSEQEDIDVAFRVISDHIRTLSFAIADGISPGNTDRSYVLRRILRRAVRYGRMLGMHEPFFHKLVDVLVEKMGGIFPELRRRQTHIEDVLHREEEAFNRTLDRGIDLFETEAAKLPPGGSIPANLAFRLYDEQGFPLDLTELMARERGLTVDVAGFETRMEEQRDRARRAQKRQIVELSELENAEPTQFVGYDEAEADATVAEVITLKNRTAVILDRSVCYAEMGGQTGDAGEIHGDGQTWSIVSTQKTGATWLHFLDPQGAAEAPAVGSRVRVKVDADLRRAVERHHTVTHLLHWALHEVVSVEASQKGSFVGAEKLTFDFNSSPVTPAQLRDMERLVNERIVENDSVSWTEQSHEAVRGRADVMQFFGDKYGDTVRVVQIGGGPGLLNGYSMELCGGTHVRATGQLGVFHIVSEGAIAAGVRRIEAVAGLAALEVLESNRDAQRDRLAELEAKLKDAEKALLRERQKALRMRAESEADGLLRRAEGSSPTRVIASIDDASGDLLQEIANVLKTRGFQGVAALAAGAEGQVSLVAHASAEWTAKFPAGEIVKRMADPVGGKGGGRPDIARGAGRNVEGIPAALAAADQFLRQ